MSAPRVAFAVAEPSDDADLRRLLRESPLPGTVTLAYEREPSFFRAAALEGPFHQAIIARDTANGEVLGMASRSVRQLWVNGVPQAVGYLSQMRASARFAWGVGGALVLARAFTLLAALHQDGRTPCYVISVVEGNPRAVRLFTAALPGYLTLLPVGRMITHALLVRPGRGRSPVAPGVVVRRAEERDADALAACLGRHGAARQLAPTWSSADLRGGRSTSGLSIADFQVALRDGEVVGCLARWDQRALKQVVVRGYGPRLARWLPLVNRAARLAGYAPLPPVGRQLDQTYASHLAVDGDDPVVFAALLGAVYRDAASRGDGLLAIGLPAEHTLAGVVARYRQVAYPSQLFLAAWHPAQLPGLDERPVWPEIATL